MRIDRDDVGVRALVDAPELLLGADVRRCGHEDGDGARLALAQALLEALKTLRSPLSVEIGWLSSRSLSSSSTQGTRLASTVSSPAFEGSSSRSAKYGSRSTMGILGRVDLVLEVDVDRALGASGCAGNLARRRAGDAVLPDDVSAASMKSGGAAWA